MCLCVIWNFLYYVFSVCKKFISTFDPAFCAQTTDFYSFTKFRSFEFTQIERLSSILHSSSIYGIEVIMAISFLIEMRLCFGNNHFISLLASDVSLSRTIYAELIIAILLNAISKQRIPFLFEWINYKFYLFFVILLLFQLKTFQLKTLNFDTKLVTEKKKMEYYQGKKQAPKRNTVNTGISIICMYRVCLFCVFIIHKKFG